LYDPKQIPEQEGGVVWCCVVLCVTAERVNTGELCTPPEYPIVAKFQPPEYTYIPILIIMWEPIQHDIPLITSHLLLGGYVWYVGVGVRG
jgi:hypothetical protein